MSESDSFDAITYVGVTHDELSSLPPGSLVIRADGDTSTLPPDLQGRGV